MENILDKHKLPRLNGIAGLKFLAMLCIVWWHIEIPNPHTDLGARMCEFLFVSSGFLVAYNSINSQKNSNPFSYMLKKFVKLWPIHVVALLSIVLLNITHFQAAGGGIWNFFINFFMMQSWVNNGSVAFGFNGVSWFVCSLMFCYFMAPLFLKFCKSIKTSSITFAVAAVSRLLIEFAQNNNSFLALNCNIHWSPIVRSLEFLMGMCMFQLFYKLLTGSARMKNKKLKFFIFTFLELTTLAVTIFLLIWFNDLWSRFLFVLVFCLFTFIFSFNLGIISKLFSLKFLDKIFALQLGIYMFQIVVNTALSKLSKHLFPQLISTHFTIYIIIEVAILIFVAWIYHKFIGKYLEKFLKKIINKAIKFLGYEFNI